MEIFDTGNTPRTPFFFVRELATLWGRRSGAFDWPIANRWKPIFFFVQRVGIVVWAMVGLIARNMKWILFLRMVMGAHADRFGCWPTILGSRRGGGFFFGIESIGALSRATNCCSRTQTAYGTRRWRRVFRFSSEINAFPPSIAIGE